MQHGTFNDRPFKLCGARVVTPHRGCVRSVFRDGSLPLILVGLVLAEAAVAADPTPVEPISVATFSEKVAPLLAARCGECHGSDTQEGSLRLDTHQGLAAGGGTGPVIVPGAAEQSLLVQAIRRVDESLSMPPDGPLPQNEIDLITAWINAGAPHPDGSLEAKPAGPDLAAARAHWSFRPLSSPPLPEGDAAHPIDRFLDAGLAEVGLVPTPAADPATLVRGLAFATRCSRFQERLTARWEARCCMWGTVRFFLITRAKMRRATRRRGGVSTCR